MTTNENTKATRILDRDQNLTSCNADFSEDVLFAGDTNGFDEIEMSFADNAIDFILDLLTDLSVNRGAYALREAFSNAYDATVVAGNMDLPIEIELPSVESLGEDTIAGALGYGAGGASVAVIRDHGCGMTEDDVRLYFTQYGGSKKRSTADMDTIGSKGLGSKAPLAVADTFTVRTTKDGITTTAILERKDGRNYASITTEETGEDSGTEVRIPVTDASVARQMIECANGIARYSFGANVLVNGVPGRSVLSETPTADDDYVYIGRVRVGEDSNGDDVRFRVWQHKDCFPSKFNRNTHTSYVLAGVGYDLISSACWSGRTSGAPVFIVEGLPGYLNFTPSRDEIKQDAARENLISALAEGMAVARADTGAMTHLLASMSPRDRFFWLKERYFDISATEEGVAFGEESDDYCIPFTVTDKSLFTTESGTDWSCALTGDMDVNGDILLASFRDKKFAVSVAKRYGDNVSVDMENMSKRVFADALSLYVPSLRSEDSNAEEPRRSIEWLLSVTNRRRCNARALVLTGMNGNAEAYRFFANAEKQVRDAVDYGECDYLFVDAERELTSAELELLSIAYDDVTCWDFGKLESSVAAIRRARAAKSKTTKREKVPPAVKQLASVSVAVYDLASPYTVDNESRSATYNVRAERKTIDFTADGCWDDRVFCFFTTSKRNSSQIVTLARLMRTCGKLDADELVMCYGWNADCVNYAEKMGAKVIYDGRTTVKSVKDSIVSAADDISVEVSGWSNRLEVSVRPAFFDGCWNKLDSFTRAEIAVRVANVNPDFFDAEAKALTKIFTAEELSGMGVSCVTAAADAVVAHKVSYRTFAADLDLGVEGSCPTYMTDEIADLTECAKLSAAIEFKCYQLHNLLSRSVAPYMAQVLRPGLAAAIAEVVSELARESADDAEDDAKLAA